MEFPTDLSNVADNVDDVLAAYINQLETKVGINGSAVVTSLDYLLKNAASSDPGHKHTPASLTLPNINCLLYKSGNQSIASGSATAITFDLESFDNGGLHSTASNTSRITIVTAGVYLFVGHIRWASNSAENRQIILKKNGANITKVVDDAAAAAGTCQEVSFIDSAAATNYYELFGYQNSGGALNAEGGTLEMTSFSCALLALT